MKFGPVPPKKLPQQDPEKVLRLAERWQRSSWAHQRWAEGAKKCVDFFEGRQWTQTQIAQMVLQRRPALTFNIIAPLVRLILGYHRSHKTDIVHKPGQDSRSSDDIAEVLSRVERSIAHASKQEFVDTEVFLDGLISARGFFDTRLNFEENDLGECITKARDPFAVKIDPDADTYDLNESAAFIQTDRMVSLDEIEGAFGKRIMEWLKPFTMGQTPLAPLSSLVLNEEVTPVRYFGLRSDSEMTDWWDNFYSLVGDFVDPYRKTIRLIESQYKVREERDVFIDLETGDTQVVPQEWGPDQIGKSLFYAQQVGNPLIVERRMVERIHWTTMAGDLILYDAPSLYDRYTITGYFPYFRRGMTRGMVEDLIDPQMEKNKRRSARVEITAKTANGGWMYHQESLTPEQERNLKKFGSTPGVNIKWKGDADKKPTQIAPATPPMAQESLEHDSDNDIRAISGINESALGELDRVQSGRAIEARQRQAVLSVQMYMDNFKRSKTLLGDAHLEIIQKHYTEQRMFRVMGEDGKFTQTIINQMQVDPAGGVKRVINDITVGKYITAIDDAPMSSTFLNAQFEEMLQLLEKMGPAMGQFLPLFSDLIIDMSSLPRKQEWIERFKAVIAAQTGAPPPGAGGPPPPGAAAPQPQQALPPPQGGGNVVPLARPGA